MIVLGLNAYHGDSSACVVVDGRLIAAAEEERFRRIKHWAGFPIEAIRYCLSESGVTIDDIDHIAVNRNPKANLLRKALFAFRNHPSLALLKDRLKNAFRIRDIKDTFSQEYVGKVASLKAKVYYVEHQNGYARAQKIADNKKNTPELPAFGLIRKIALFHQVRLHRVQIKRATKQIQVMDYKNIYYPESRFGGFTDVDGTIAFYIRLNSFITSSSVLLDVGCGKGDYAEDPIYLRRELRVFKGKCRKVIGIDVDRVAKENPFLDEFRPIESNHWPLDNESVDVCLCDNVVEHVEDPDLFFSECQRVIKQGGYLCIRTPNVLSYFGLFSKIIPNRLHLAVVGKVQSQREGKAVFPTRYRCNTKWKMSRTLNKFGFDYCVYGYEAEPSYLSFSRFFYHLGVLHQRFAPKVFRTTIFAFGKKR